MGKEVSPGLERERSPYLFDVIVVLGADMQGKGYHKHPTGEEAKPQIKFRVELDFCGKMRIIAAAEAVRRGLAPILVLSGGKTAGEEYPSEAQVMQRVLERKYRNSGGKFSQIPPESIILEERSKDTSTNLEHLLQLIKEKGWNKVALLTNDFHRERVTKLARNFGLTVEHLSAENMLQKRYPRFSQVVQNFYTSPRMRSIQRTEKILMLMLKVDPKARIPRYLASRMRG